MDGQKSSKGHFNTAVNSDGLKVKVKSSRATPTLIFTGDRKDSIYEINIHSSFNFHNKLEQIHGFNAKDTARVSFFKVGTTSLVVESEENSKECKIMENPLMELHYQSFPQGQTEVKPIPLNAERIDTNVQTDMKFEGEDSEGKKTEVLFKKPDKENQTLVDSESVKDLDKRKNYVSRKESDESFKQRMKNCIMENFISKNDETMKTLFKNFCERMDNDQLHLHHHEHHHHYYFDNSAILNGKESESLSFNQDFSGYRKNSSTPRRKNSRERKPSRGKGRMGDKQQTKQAYYFRCPKESNMTFTKTSSGELKFGDNKIFLEKMSKIEGKRSGIFTASRSRFSSSAESILNKKSDFITTHIYSDTELAKCDSTMMHCGEFSEIGPRKSKEAKKNPVEDYRSLYNSLKSFNHIMTPVIITDQKTAPKISYVKCECSLKNSTAQGGRNRCKSSGQNQRKTHSDDGRTDKFENTEKETDKIQNLLPIPEKKNKRKDPTPGETRNEIWTVKLKTELTEIKKELKRIEEKHLRDSKSLSPLFNDNESRENSHQISVYSSKTYIFGAENVFQEENTELEEIENEIKHLLETPDFFYKKVKMDVYLNRQKGMPEKKKNIS